MAEVRRRFQQFTFLSKVCEKYPGLDETLSEVCNYFKSKIKIYRANYLPHSLAINELAEEETDEAIQNGFRRITELVKKLDIDIDAFILSDEFDRSLHPVLFKQLVRLFKDKRYNKNNAQLIFTTHTTDILDDDIIRVSEVGIVSKTLKTGTTLKRLSDFEDIRNVNNFRKQYLAGRFSGIPFSYV